MLNSYLYILIFTSLSILPPLFIAMWRYKSMEKYGKILHGYLWISLIIYEIAMWYTSLNSIHNHFLLNIYIPLEFILISYIYWLLLETKSYKTTILVVASLTLVFQILSNITYWDSFNRFNSTANVIPNLGIMLFVIMYFYELLKNGEMVNLLTFPLFWISAGILLYVSVNLFLFIFGEFVLFNNSSEISKLWIIIQSISNIIYRILLTIGLWFSKTPQQLSPSSK